jgi:hypothetical protein
VEVTNYISSEYMDGKFYETGWIAAAQLGDVVAVEVPTFIEREPTGTQMYTVRVTEDGAAEPVTDQAAEGNALACLTAQGDPLPSEPDWTCQKAELSSISSMSDAVRPLRDQEFTKAVQVEAGDGFRVIAARLKNGQTQAWAHNPSIGDGWAAGVTLDWMGGGTPDNKAIVWGPAAQDAALKCLS